MMRYKKNTTKLEFLVHEEKKNNKIVNITSKVIKQYFKQIKVLLFAEAFYV